MLKALMVAVVATAVTVGQDAWGQSGATIDCRKLNATANHGAMDHSAHNEIMEKCGGVLPGEAGQAAFGAISEIVRLLKSDPNTDWSKVNIEALRQHLIDMNDVVMNAVVTQRNVPGGIEMRITGTGRTTEAIQRMMMNHTKMLDQGKEYHASASALPDGALVTVTARKTADSRAVAQIRGLGFAGLITEGDHHAGHHLAVARGEPAPHGK